MLGKFIALTPKKVEEVTYYLQKYRDKAVIKAGGTALIPEMRLGLKAPDYVVLINDVAGLDYIKETSDGLSIGAAASLYAIKNNSIVRKKYPALVEAVEAVSAPSMHYQSTIGGNICQDTRCIYFNQSEFWRSTNQACFKTGGSKCLAVPAGNKCQAVFQGDITPMLMCLDAKVKVVSHKKEKVIGIKELYTGRGDKPLRLNPNQLVTEVIIPDLGHKRCVYEKLRERGSLDYPLLGIAVMVELKGKMVNASKFVVTAMAPCPVEITDPSLSSRNLDDDFIEDAAGIVQKRVKPVANILSTPAYRKKMSKVVVRHALRRCMI
jgi:4-hydroxybenzoyl-CoA reductase subunit beta